MTFESVAYFIMGLETFLLVVLVTRYQLLKIELKNSQRAAISAKIALANYTVDKPTLLSLIKQAKALNWDLGIKPSYDNKTNKLLALATDPHVNENEARNAALLVCKRIKKVR